MNQEEGQMAPEAKEPGRTEPVERVGMLTRTADGREFSLGYGSLRIGRQRRADLVIDDKTVSRHHADICYESGRYVLYDHSTNGTWVNDLLVAVAQPLRDSDRVKFGGSEYVFSHKPLERRAGGRPLEQTAARRVEETETLVVREGAKKSSRVGMLVVLGLVVVGAAAAIYFFVL